ncbi:terpenoid synthase [Penicillium coprophilum]|uniref:terpenoid synthase n=1 Tax=Penicillium coprophilum TaxID=36646 RepID=UPI0023A30D10|nr:terpenoid synthase [Penicillium coprophilum]KAJ5158778.1 terpenoid synthase [Penicillium coprophilum]
MVYTTTNSLSQLGTTVTPAEFTSLAKTLLGKFNVDTSTQLHIEHLKEHVIHDSLIAKDDPVITDKMATHGALVAVCFFPRHPIEVQEAITQFACAFFLLDDGGHKVLNELRSFRKNLITGNEQKSAILALFQRSLLAMDDHYGAFSVDMLVGSVIKSVSANIVEYEGISYQADQMSADFPRYFRWMTGFAEAFAWLIPFKKEFGCVNNVFAAESLLLGVMPDLADLTCVINDVMSFYKESVVGDEYENFVHQQARVQNTSVGQVLEHLTVIVQDRFNGVLRAIDSNMKLYNLVQDWVKGQVLLYFKCARYRLDELNILS